MFVYIVWYTLIQMHSIIQDQSDAINLNKYMAYVRLRMILIKTMFFKILNNHTK